ncbi:MAG: CbiX/SirB N-terminal domain-containing protein [Candidatus Methylomirabilaceae bacterium]
MVEHIQGFRRMAAAWALGFMLVGGPPAVAQTGLLVVAHGANAAWNARVRETMTQVRWTHGPMAVAFLMGSEAKTAGWDSAVDSLLAAQAKSIVVVPLMVSSYGGHYREIEYYAGMRDSVAGHHMEMRHGPPPVPTRVTPALDAAPELGDAIVARWSALSERDRARPVLLVAHGPSNSVDAAHWLVNLRSAAGALPAAGLRAPFAVALLWDDADPPLRAAAVGSMRDTVNALAATSHDSVTVIAVLISSGSIDRQKLPGDLEGLPVRYTPTPLAPLPALARWIERSAAASLGPSPAGER